MDKPSNVVDELVEITHSYNAVFRKSLISRSGARFDKESLLSHVGHLPVLATKVYPYVSHRKEIDLGKSLIMLALHDIGETKLGDRLDYLKTSKESVVEYDSAFLLVNKMYHPVLKEFVESQTYCAKFALSVDKLAPHIYELQMANNRLQDRMAQLGYSYEDIQTRKAYFDWDDFLGELFDEIILRLQSKVK